MLAGRPTVPPFILCALLAVLLVLLPACDLLPQTAGEWTIALVVAGVLVVGVGVMAWVTTRQNKK
jgi:LPXTG-motif cell wall-anchored protein